MSKKTVIILICCAVFVLLAAAAVFVVTQYYLPYRNAVSAMTPDSQLTLIEQADGRICVSWPAGENVDQYLFEILEPHSGSVVYTSYISGQTDHIIDPLPADQIRTIRITPVAGYSVPFQEQERMRLGDQVIAVTDRFGAPKIRDITWTPLPDTDQVAVALELPENCQGRMYRLADDGSATLSATLSSGRITLSFGENQGFPIPKDGEQLAFAFDAFRQGAGYVFHSRLSDPRYLVREDLLDDFLAIRVEDNGCNIYTLTWNETAGKHYELQGRVFGTEEWVTLATVTDDAPRSYTTPRLSSLVQMEYRVSCPDTLPMLESPVTTVQASGNLLYSTVWPIKHLPVYDNADCVTAIGTISRATAHCVLGMENGMFKIRFADTYGYIDSNSCMINLPDYLGDHCLYNITNSYQSLYKAHDYDIPEVTGSLVEGYEQVLLGQDKYLVPLLYPAALKLEKAVLSAAERGCKLLIYDSYRPQKATLSLHDLTLAFSKTNVPQEDPNAKPMTFGQYMTDFYRFTLANFIASGSSRHNQGIAMDLTLVVTDPALFLPGEEDGGAMTATIPTPDAGEEELPYGPDGELIMQTVMHDLTWYSERKRNNDNAKLLAEIMQGAGFVGIASEWWHYQDNDALYTHKPPVLYEGISAEGWVTNDGQTWRYRSLSGAYLTDCTAVIDGEMYAFDADGCATWQEYPKEQEGAEK